MSTLVITPTNTATTDTGYLHNVGRAVRALLAALISVPHKAAPAPAPAKVRTADNEVSIYRLYRMAAQYDSVMPNLAQELRAIAARNGD